MSGKILVAVDMSKMSEEVFSTGAALRCILRLKPRSFTYCPTPLFAGVRAVAAS